MNARRSVRVLPRVPKPLRNLQLLPLQPSTYSAPPLRPTTAVSEWRFSLFAGSLCLTAQPCQIVQHPLVVVVDVLAE